MITLTSKSGNTATMSVGAEIAYLETKGVKFQVQRHPSGLEAVFPVRFGDKKVRPVIALSDAEKARAYALLSEMESAIKDRHDQLRELDEHHDRIIQAMNPDG